MFDTGGEQHVADGSSPARAAKHSISWTSLRPRPDPNHRQAPRAKWSDLVAHTRWRKCWGSGRESRRALLDAERWYNRAMQIHECQHWLEAWDKARGCGSRFAVPHADPYAGGARRGSPVGAAIGRLSAGRSAGEASRGAGGRGFRTSLSFFSTGVSDRRRCRGLRWLMVRRRPRVAVRSGASERRSGALPARQAEMQAQITSDTFVRCEHGDDQAPKGIRLHGGPP